nr:MAG TPA: hypothetical protein [Caudoviricetes sp.]
MISLYLTLPVAKTSLPTTNSNPSELTFFAFLISTSKF